MTAGRLSVRTMSRRTRFFALAAAALVASATAAGAEERVFIRGAQGSLTVFDAVDLQPRGGVALGATSLWGMAASPATQRLYAFDITPQTVLEIDAVRGQVVGSISLASLRFTPYGMAASADGTRLYFAANNRELGLIAVDLELGILRGEVAVPYAWRVVPHPDGSKVYVTTRAGELYVVRASDLAILGHRFVGGEEIALNADGSRLYAAGAGSLQVIDTATDQLLDAIAPPFAPDHLAVSGRWAYVGNKEMGVLGVIDLVDGHTEAEITLDTGRYVRVGGINVTADGARVVVLLDNDLRYKYAVVDGAQHTLIGLHEGVGGSLICSSRFIMDVTVPEAVFTVNSAVDAPDAAPGDGACETAPGNGACTLRAAIQEGNAAAGAASIAVPAGEYLLSIAGMDEDEGATGDLDVRGTLTIRGAGSATTVVDGGALDRVLDVAAGGFLRLEGVTVRNGHLPSRDPLFFKNRAGAGIFNAGVLVLEGVKVAANVTGGFGGAGVHSAGALRAEDCTFSDNVSRGVGCYLDFFGVPVCGETEGYGAIYAAQAELAGCLATGNAGETAVWIVGTVADSVVSDNDARGVRATSVVRSTVSGNRGPGCVASLVADSTVRGNLNPDPDGCGGGVLWDDRYRKLVVARSTISGNAAARGGGVCAQFFDMENSTVSGNAAAGDGGGLYVLAYDEWNAVRSCTITANVADSDGDGAGDGGGIFNEHAGTSYDTHLAGTILAGNLDLGGEAPDCAGYLGSDQFNLVGNVTGCGFAPLAWDIVGTAEAPADALLGPLEDNGGPTLTHAPLAGSPVVDAGHPYVFPAADQRGVARPQDGDADGVARSDIGALEAAPAPWTVTATAGEGGSITPEGALSVPHAGSASYAIAPDEHHHVADVLVDGVSVGAVTSWTFDDVRADHTIAASFAVDTYTIRLVAGVNGSIAPRGSVEVPRGGSLSVRVRPRAGYQVARLLVDGKSVGARLRYTLRDCAGDHLIQARFLRVP